MGSEAKPRVTVRNGCAFVMHHATGDWRKFFMSDQTWGWTPEGFDKAWREAVAWSRGPAPQPATPNA